MARKALLTVASAVVTGAAVLAGCSPRAAVPAGPSTASAAAAVPAALVPGCAPALAALPASAPDTQKQAGDDTDALDVPAGTTAASLAAAVSADSFSIGLDLAEQKSDVADVAQWQADARALRSYCG